MTDHLSRVISRALRHAPDEYGLVLDSKGWAPVTIILEGIRSKHDELRTIEELDIHRAAEHGERFELREGRMRALYGHSSADIDYGASQSPPTQLFHATSTRAFAEIAPKGLIAGGRRYVHLTSSWDYVLRIYGQRREESGGAVILVVAAKEAADQTGAPFFKASESIWLTTYVGRNHLSLAILAQRQTKLAGLRPLMGQADSRSTDKESRLGELFPEE